MIKKIKDYINKSEFTKNALTLITGTSLAQILIVAISPILSRIYTPIDFGILALFSSITMIFGTIANGRYELAIILPKKDKDAINIFALGIIISIFLSIILFIFTITFHSQIVVWLDNQKIASWLYFIPLVVLFIGCFNVLNYFSTRKKYYKNIATSRILKGVSTALIQISFNFLKKGPFGLISGFSTGHFVSSVSLTWNIIKDKKLLKKINKQKMLLMAKKYSRFPKLTLPASLANILSAELTNILISTVFTVTTLGYYSFAISALSAPATFIGQSVSQVYFQEASDEKKRSGFATGTFRSVVIKLLVVGFPLFLFIFLFSEWIFSFVFGEEWRLAGTYAKIITPLLYVRFVVAPVSVSLSIFEKQHISLFWQIGLLIFSLGAVGITIFLNLNFINFLYIFVITLTIYYLFFLSILNKVVKAKI